MYPTPLTPRTTLISSTSTTVDTKPEPYVLTIYSHPITHHNHTSPGQISVSPSPYHPRTFSAYTHATQTIVHAPQSQEPPYTPRDITITITVRPKTTT